jgi:hypothetical protein
MNMSESSIASESRPGSKGVPVSDSFPCRILRLEALVIAVASIAAYREMDGSWGMYFVLWLVPDLFMLGYFISAKAGSIAYNFSHNQVLPAVMCTIGFLQADPLLTQLGLLWVSHVAIDRALGYGLKYETGFRETHLGRC